MEVVLNEVEIAELDRQDPAKEKAGGWQGLIVGFQKKVNRATGQIELTPKDIKRIQKYAFYDRGTWETQLKNAFGRTLGPKLDGVIG
jgi:hypothetical protein